MLNAKFLSMILGSALLPAVAMAQTVVVNPDAPEAYTVQKGDTLWGISGRFLRDPWRWRHIWEDNPQIKNPDLIFPGDQIVLSYREGEPVMQVRRGGRPTVKLSPSVREIPLESVAVHSIPIDAIQQFLTRPRVVGATELDEAPYVVSLQKEHLIGGAGHKIYVRGVGNEPETRYTVYRRGSVYTDPDYPDDVLGYEALHIGDAVLEKTGDPATMVLSRTNREVLTGDRLLPATEDEIDSHFFPSAPDQEVSGKIIEVVEGVSQIGQHQVVVLSLGTSDGIDIGDVMAVYQAGENVEDPLARRPQRPRESYIEYDPKLQGGIDGLGIAADRLVRDLQDLILTQYDRFAHPRGGKHQRVDLPEERAGLVMVFRPYERVSYALVVDATRAMFVNDTVKNP